jgi:hypothetical protein
MAIFDRYRHLYHGNLERNGLEWQYSISKINSGHYNYSISTHEHQKKIQLVQDEYEQIFNTIILVNKIKSSRYAEGYSFIGNTNQLNYLLTLILLSVYRNHGKSSIRFPNSNKITCTFGNPLVDEDGVQLKEDKDQHNRVKIDIAIWKIKENEYKIAFIDYCVNKNAFKYIEKIILCEINRSYLKAKL